MKRRQPAAERVRSPLERPASISLIATRIAERQAPCMKTGTVFINTALRRKTASTSTVAGERGMSANMTSSGQSGGSSRNPSLTDVGASVPDPSESGTVGLTGSTLLNKLNQRTRSSGNPLESSILTASEPGMTEGTGKEKSLRATFPSSSDSTLLFASCDDSQAKQKGCHRPKNRQEWSW